MKNNKMSNEKTQAWLQVNPYQDINLWVGYSKATNRAPQILLYACTVYNVIECFVGTSDYDAQLESMAYSIFREMC